MRNVGKEIFKRLGMQIWFSDGTNEKKRQFLIREYNVLTCYDIVYNRKYLTVVSTNKRSQAEVFTVYSH